MKIRVFLGTFIASEIKHDKKRFVRLLIYNPPETVTEPLEISDLVRELRQRCGLTQQEFSACLGVTFVTVNRWENQHSKPSKMAMKLLEEKVKELGDRGEDLLSKYFYK